jgi:hypothetical protein
MKFNYPNNTGISYSLYVEPLPYPRRSRADRCPSLPPLFFNEFPSRSVPLSHDTAWHAHSTDTGFFEEAQYRYTANASNPSCIQATIFWQHGKFGLNDNGSITLYPFSSDGRIQVQDPCAATTNIITYYNQQVSWRVRQSRPCSFDTPLRLIASSRCHLSRIVD